MHELLNHHELAGDAHDVEHRHDIAMAHLRRDASLVEEHRQKLLVVGECRIEALRGDEPREPFAAERARDVDPGHATACDLPM